MGAIYCTNLEDILSRVINPDNSGKERNRLTKAIVKAIRELMTQSEPDDNSRDMAAFIALALLQVHETVDVSVLAWEKRGYWLKADRFRLEWEWAQQLGLKMGKAILEDDWVNVAMVAAQVAQKLSKIQIAPKNRIGEPWVGAWEKLKEGKN